MESPFGQIFLQMDAVFFLIIVNYQCSSVVISFCVCSVVKLWLDEKIVFKADVLTAFLSNFFPFFTILTFSDDLA